MADFNTMTDSFPRQLARTQRFTLGEPRNLVVSPDGGRVVFLRSTAGNDPVNRLYVLDLVTGDERLVADPPTLLAVGLDELPPEERRRRERAREGAGGITSFATDPAVRVASFTLGGQLFVAGLLSGTARPLPVEGPVFDPRPDPTASRLAYVQGRTLRIAELDGSSRELAGEGADTVSWGSADFIAAEEMGRSRGYWWSPDGAAIACTRVDVAPVHTWYIANPGEPSHEPTPIRYPAAGTPNADVTLHIRSLAGGSVQVRWDHQGYPYLAQVMWLDTSHVLLTVQSRDQRSLQVLMADTTTGATRCVHDDYDDAWVELVPGTPTVLHDGTLVMCADRDGARRLLIDGTPVTPTDLQVRSVIAASGDVVTFIANPIDDATVQHVWQHTADGLRCVSSGDGIHTAAVGGPAHSVVALRSATLAADRATTTVHRPDAEPLTITTFADTPMVQPNVHLHRYTVRQLATAVLLPHHHDGSALPVILDPYGGPHALRVVQSRIAFAASQWLADQGFAVLVTDGSGTPGRGSAWERSVHLDLATAVLDDQVDALHAAARDYPLDLHRVAIRGWSFGGYLAALAVLRRPNVFHAAVAGAPVTEWRLYDTHYTERYLGNPSTDPAPYDATSLLPLAAELTRPLLLVHGLADDNVVAAHSLQLSNALLAAGRSHEVLPLVGVTHMTPQEVVAENLLLHQLDFIKRALAIRS